MIFAKLMKNRINTDQNPPFIPPFIKGGMGGFEKGKAGDLKNSCKTGQSILEYSVIITVVALALMAMQQYVLRAVNARLEQVRLELDESAR